jgi:hypothetical protein
MAHAACRLACLYVDMRSLACLTRNDCVFTAYTNSNLVSFNANLIFGNKKSQMGLGQVSAVDVPTR